MILVNLTSGRLELLSSKFSLDGHLSNMLMENNLAPVRISKSTGRVRFVSVTTQVKVVLKIVAQTILDAG